MAYIQIEKSIQNLLKSLTPFSLPLTHRQTLSDSQPPKYAGLCLLYRQEMNCPHGWDNYLYSAISSALDYLPRVI